MGWCWGTSTSCTSPACATPQGAPLLHDAAYYTLNYLPANPSANSLTFSASGPYLLESGTLTLTGSDVTANSAATISSAINSTVGLYMTGSAALTLTGSTGLGSSNLTVDLGTLNISGSGAVSDSSGYIGDNAGYSGTVTVSGSGSSWTNSSELYVGESGSGTLQIANGATASTSGYSYVGYNAGSSGTVTVSGTSSTWTLNGPLEIGYFGNGTLQITSGAVVSDYFNGSTGIGYNAGSTGTMAVSGTGSTLITYGGLYIGYSGTGTLQITNGGAVFSTVATLGYNAGSSGTATVSGTGSTWRIDGPLDIGYSGTGTLQITNGATASAGLTGSSSIGYDAGSSGTVTVSGLGSTLTTGGELYVGYSGTGTLQITNGATASDGLFYEGPNGSSSIGDNAGSSGTVTVSGTGSTFTTDSIPFYVGYSGTGMLQITDGGGAVNEFGGGIGYNAGSSGMAAVSGSGSTWTTSGPLYIGYSGTGTLQITNGGAGVTSGEGEYILGYNAGSSGTVTVSGTGSTWTSSGELDVGYFGTGTVQITNGGTVNIGDGYIGDNPGSSGMVTVSGSGSTWTTSGQLDIGYLGTGALQITNGGAVSSPVAYIGSNYGSLLGSGMVTVSGSGSTWTNSGALYIGSSGIGTLQITNGGAVTSGEGYLGYMPGSTGMVTVYGTGSTWTVTQGLSVGDQQFYGSGNSGLLRIASGGSVSVGNDGTTIYGFGMLAFGENATFNSSSLLVDAGTVTLVDGQLQTVTLTTPVTITAGSYLDFDVGNGSDQIAFAGSGSINVTGAVTVNVYGLSGQLTSGTDVLIDGATSGYLSLGNVYNGGNFTYSLLSTSTSEDVIVTATSALTTAYWSGNQNNLWNILLGGTATNWTTNPVDPNDPLLTPSATTDVIFSDDSPNYEFDSVLGGNMTIKSLTINYPGLVVISGSDPNPWLGTDTLTISGSTGTTGITVNSGAGSVTIAANLYLSGSSQTITVNNAAGLLISGSLGSSNGLIKAGAGALTLTGPGNFGAGTVDVEYGTLAIQNSFSNHIGDIGINAGANGTVTVSGIGSNWKTSGDLYVGDSGAGTLQITSGGAVSDTNGWIGNAGGSVGNVIVTGTGSKWTNSGNLTIGNSGTGTLTLVDGGQLTVGGTTSLGAAGTLRIDNTVKFNTGSLAFNGGTLVTLASLDTPGMVTVDAGGMTINTNGFNSTFAGSATGPGGLVKQGAGTRRLLRHRQPHDLRHRRRLRCLRSYIGYGAGSTGTVTVSGTGSKWTTAGSLTIGDLGTGTLIVQNGGCVSVTGATTIGSAGTLEFDGNSPFNAGSLTVNGGTLVTLGAATFAPSATLGAGGVKINSDGFNSTFSGNFSGTGGIAKSGAGA
jgi:fibronectin-binding autotransporter adhesin